MIRRLGFALALCLATSPSWSALRITGAKDMRATLGKDMHGTAGDSRWITFTGAASTPIRVYLCDSPLREACHDGSATSVQQTVTASSVSSATFTVVTSGLSSGADGALHYLFAEDGGNNKSQLWKFMVDGTVPNPTGYTGTLNHGENIRLVVANAGDYGGDFNSGAGRILHLFDNFNDGTLLSNSYATWTHFNAENNVFSLQTSSPRTAVSGDGFARRRGDVSLGNLWITAGNHGLYYATYWRRFAATFSLAGTRLSPADQMKDIRLYSTNFDTLPGNTGKPNVYPSYADGNGATAGGFNWGGSVEFTSPQVLHYQLSFSFSVNPGVWQRIDVLVDKSSSAGAYDGILAFWQDGVLKMDFLDRVKDLSGLPHKGDFDNDGGNFAGDWAILDYIYGGDANDYVEVDDVALTHSIARVEICSGSTWANKGACEYQEVTNWQSTYVDLIVNRGAHPAGSTRYFYAVDKNGNVNLTGLSATFGNSETGGDVTAPSISVGGITNLTHNGYTANATANEPSTWIFDYGPTTSYGSQQTISAFTTSAAFNVAGLTPNSLSNYRFKATDAAGNLRTGGNNTVTTLSSADTTVPTISDALASEINDLSILYQFIPSEDLFFSIDYSTDTSYSLHTATVAALAGIVKETTISGLLVGTLYNARVNVQDAAGNQATYTGYTWQTVPEPVSPGEVTISGWVTLQ